MPVKTGIQVFGRRTKCWIPACAGMTEKKYELQLKDIH